MKGYVYILSCEPHSSKYYIGITKRTLEKRYYEHLKIKKNDHRSSWIKSLLNKGLTPVIEELDFAEAEDAVELEKQLNYLEVFYIGLFRSWNIKLVNNGDGGNQNLNHKVPEYAKEKMRIAHTGKTLTEDHKKNISIALKAVPPPSESVRNKISNSLKGHLVSEKTRKLLRENTPRSYGNTFSAKLNLSDVYEVIRLLKEGRKCKDIAADFNVHPSNISAIKNKRGWKNIWDKLDVTFNVSKNTPKDIIAAAVNEYVTGNETVEALAKKYNVSSRGFSYWITQAGHRIQPRSRLVEKLNYSY